MQTVTVAGGTLFQVAAQYLNDATQWNRIAGLNGILDPWLLGLTVLQLPTPDARLGGGVGFQ